MIYHFKRLYEYNAWANELFTKALRKSDFKNDKISLLFSHIATAQLIWMDRIDRVPIKIPGVFEILPFEEAAKSLKIGNQLWLDLLDKHPDISTTINYQNTKGLTFSTSLSDILTHVANHGTHHRGQIASLLRDEGIAPPPSDFIFYVRQLS